MPRVAASPGSMMVSQVNVGDGVFGSEVEIGFPSTLAPEKRPVKKDLDYLAAPLAAFRAGEYRRAARMFEEIVMLHPEILDAAFHLARSLQEAGDIAGAREWYQEVLRTPNHPQSAHAISRLTALGGELPSLGGPTEPAAADPVAQAAAEEPAAADPVAQAPVEEPAAEAPAAEAPAAEEPAAEAPAAAEPAAEEPAAEEPAAEEASAEEAAADDGQGKKGKKGKKGR